MITHYNELFAGYGNLPVLILNAYTKHGMQLYTLTIPWYGNVLVRSWKSKIQKKRHTNVTI